MMSDFLHMVTWHSWSKKYCFVSQRLLDQKSSQGRHYFDIKLVSIFANISLFWLQIPPRFPKKNRESLGETADSTFLAISTMGFSATTAAAGVLETS